MHLLLSNYLKGSELVRSAVLSPVLINPYAEHFLTQSIFFSMRLGESVSHYK